MKKPNIGIVLTSSIDYVLSGKSAIKNKNNKIKKKERSKEAKKKGDEKKRENREKENKETVIRRG